MSTGPIERKVTGATGGSAAGVALAGLVLWMLDAYAWKEDPIPDAVTFAVVTLLPIGLTFAGGYLARHTARADPDALRDGSKAERLADRDRRIARADLDPGPAPGAHRRVRRPGDD